MNQIKGFYHKKTALIDFNNAHKVNDELKARDRLSIPRLQALERKQQRVFEHTTVVSSDFYLINRK